MLFHQTVCVWRTHRYKLTQAHTLPLCVRLYQKAGKKNNGTEILRIFYMPI